MENICRLELKSGILAHLSDDAYLSGFYHKINNSGEKLVTINLSNVSFLDSACIALIVKLNKYCMSIGRHFSIEHPNSNVKDLLHKVNLDRVIPIVD